MTFKEKVENNITLWLLGTLLTGFLAGIGAYKAVLEMAQLEVIPSGDLASLRQVADTNDISPAGNDRERRALYAILANRLEAGLRETKGKTQMVEEGFDLDEINYKRMQRAVFFSISALQADPLILEHAMSELEKRGLDFIKTMRPRVLAEFPALRKARLRWLQDNAVPALENAIRDYGPKQGTPSAEVPLPKILLVKKYPMGMEPKATVSNLGNLEDEIRLIKDALD